jgi:hypothetical protein
LRGRRLFERVARGPAALLCVYRRENHQTVRALIDQARRLDLSIALWALDEPLADLTAFTVGIGPGSRVDLLNRLWQEVSARAPHQVVIADDDMRFTHGTLDQLLGAATRCEFGIAQPAHHWDSYCSHEITRKRVLSLARETTFVEVGPLFVVTQPWIPRVLPFPEGFGMGWGLELVWWDLLREGCRLGVVDCVSVMHPAPEGGSREYDTDPEGERLRSLLRERNLETITDAQCTLTSWRAWQARPRWHAPEGRQR